MAESQENVNSVKAATEKVAQKAKSDSSFAAQLKSEPVATLRAAGLPDGAIGETLKKWNVQPEVSGYTYAYVDECVYYTAYVEYYWACTYFTS